MDHLFGKELFILFAASAFRKLSSIYVFSYFPFGFEGRIWDLIVSIPDHCLSFYFNIKPVYQEITLSSKLGVLEISTLLHFRLSLLIQMFIKVSSFPPPDYQGLECLPDSLISPAEDAEVHFSGES